MAKDYVKDEIEEDDLDGYIRQYDKAIKGDNLAAARNILNGICKGYPHVGVSYLLEADFIYHSRYNEYSKFNKYKYGDNAPKESKVTVYSDDMKDKGLRYTATQQRNSYVELLNSAETLMTEEEKLKHAARIKRLNKLVENFDKIYNAAIENEKKEKKKDARKDIILAIIFVPIAVALAIYIITSLIG